MAAASVSADADGSLLRSRPLQACTEACYRCAAQGRPKGPEDKYRLAPVYKRLQQLLAGVPVLYVGAGPCAACVLPPASADVCALDVCYCQMIA